MNPQPDPEALERRRLQNRIAQRKHRQKRAPVEREPQQQQQQQQQEQERSQEEVETHQRKQDGDHQKPPIEPQSYDFENSTGRQGNHSTGRCTHCCAQQSQKITSEFSQEASRNGNIQSGPEAFDPPTIPEDTHTQSTLQRGNAVPSASSGVGHAPPSLIDKVPPNSVETDFQYEFLTTPEIDDDLFFNTILEPTTYAQGAPSSHTPVKSSEGSRFVPPTMSPEEVNHANNLTCRKRPRSFICTPVIDTAPQLGNFQALARPSIKTRRRTSPHPLQPTVLEYRSAAPSWEIHKGKTVLHLCAERGNSKMVQFLLSRGADIDRQDGYGRTALQYASKNSHLEVVAKLLESGADTEIVDCEGFNALHVAADMGSEEIITLLTQEGADLNSGIGVDMAQVDDMLMCCS